MSTDVTGRVSEPINPLMVELAQPVWEDPAVGVTMGAMTKYKTFNGEEINGEKVWKYDYHDDDV